MQIKKFVGIFFAGVVLILGFWWVGSACYQAWNGYQWQKQTDAFMEAGRKPYKDDTYGGKTPEETWTMFLDALKKGDVELASKYFVVEKQGEWLNTLSKTKNNGGLPKVLSNLPSQLSLDPNQSQSDKKYFYYNVSDSNGKFLGKNSVVLSLNTYTKIWKISVL